MVFSRVLFFGLTSLFLLSATVPIPGSSQEGDRIWGRVRTVTGDVHEGFIRWDRNEAGWVDQLDGSKERKEFLFRDWWRLAHPGDERRDRVVELAGYRITWDDEEPDFPSSHESGIRFGHVLSLVPVDDQTARLELRSGLTVELSGGSTDLGEDVREILVESRGGEGVELEWEDLERVDFMDVPPGTRPRGRRLYGTVELRDGPSYTGGITWDGDETLTSDTLDGYDSDGNRREILFGQVATVRSVGEGAEVVLVGGEGMELYEADDVDLGHAGIQISDRELGMVDADWDEVEKVTFHAPDPSASLDAFDGGRRLRGTLVTADSTEFTGWIKWDGDEEYTWELLDGSDEQARFDVEFGKIRSIERPLEEVTSVNLGPAGMRVDEGARVKDGVLVTLIDGRVLEMGGSNDVDESNNGIFVLEDRSGRSPDDEEAEWIMVRWDDFRAIRFEEEGDR